MMKLLKLITSFIITFAAAAIGNITTLPNIDSWYARLDKPEFTPPNWVFGPVWTVLYILMAIALYLVWIAPSKKKSLSRKSAFIAFGVQLALNTAWSVVFFGLHAPLTALFIILVLIGAILLTIKQFMPFSRPAAAMLVPYALWVSFATLLNAGVVALY